MTDYNPKPSDSHLIALSTNSYEIQLFIDEFQSNPRNSKTFTIIEENFIKKFRFKNSLSGVSDQFKSLTQFIQNYKQTLKYYQNYHQYLQSTLDNYPFCKDLKKFYRDLHRSQHKSLSFFLDQIEFHKAFVQQNEVKYGQKINEMKQVCVNCKQNYNQKLFENMKQNVVYPFNDQFEFYQKNRHNYGAQKNLSLILEKLSNQKVQTKNQNIFKMGLQQIQLAQTKMRSLIKQSKSISGNALQDIFDMFQHKQEIEVESVNKVRINEMFYDLQNDLNIRSNQIEEYIQELMNFNDRLINYNPNLTNKLDVSDQSMPQIVEQQLKLNLQKIVKKIYKKVTELIQKRKDQSISVQCQANFSQQNVLRELQRQKKKLTIQLKQCQEEKKSLVNGLKNQNQQLTTNLKEANQQRIKAEIAKQQAYTDKSNAHKQSDRLIKVVSQMKKQIQRLTYLLQKQKGSSRFGKTDLRSADKKSSKFNEDKSKQKSLDSQEINTKISTVQNELTEQSQKGLDNQMLEQIQKNQIQLIKNLANKGLRNKKKFAQPKRSKLLDNITIAENPLSKQIKRMSNFASSAENNQFQNDSKHSHSSNQSNQERSDTSTLKDLEQIDDNNVQKNTISKGYTLKSKITQKSKKTIQNHKQIVPKNHKSKTFTQLFKKGQQEIKDHGRSSKDISQSSQDIQRQLEQLQKIKKMKQIQIKLASITKNTKANQPRKSALGFNIQKQVQENILSPCRKNLSKGKQQNSSSTHSIQKQDLVKRFGKPSVANIFNSSQARLSTKQFQFQTKEPRKSNVSISSQNYMKICDQIYKQIEQNLCHIGTQASQSYEDLFKTLFDMEVKNRNFNQMILTYDSFKFGYEEFLTQLMAIILKEEANPIRKLNSYKGSSSVLKKNHNYRFTKENLLNRSLKEGDTQNAFENTMTKPFSRTIDERSYFAPKTASEEKKAAFNSNQTMSNFAFNRPSAKETSYKLLNCVTIADFKNLAKQNQSFKDMSVTEGQGFRKKGCYTLHNVKTDGTEGISYEQIGYLQEQESQKLLNIEQTFQEKEILSLPSFQKQDAENLFFSIESARVFEEKVQSQGTHILPFMALEQHEIKLSTQILTILAHIHLIQPLIYQQIKKLLLYPAKVLSSKNNQIEGQQNTQNQAELSLKKGLGHILQLHRKCLSKGTSHQNLRKNGKSTQETMKRGTPPCVHLQNFKQKIVQVIKTQNALKNSSNQQFQVRKQ